MSDEKYLPSITRVCRDVRPGERHRDCVTLAQEGDVVLRIVAKPWRQWGETRVEILVRKDVDEWENAWPSDVLVYDGQLGYYTTDHRLRQGDVRRIREAAEAARQAAGS